MENGSGHFTLDIKQLTHGPNNHFFGYIGHAGTIPWSHDGRYILALRTTFQDHMPGPGEPADICLIDTQNDYAVEKVDETCGWNPQQGTMYYWNPDPDTCQFFFNDRDPATGKIFTVLYDIEKKKRIREYRFEDTPIANGGVAQKGGAFLALNYGRMARLRPVTGYPGTSDWSKGADPAPDNDGIFVVDTESGEKRLLVSFRQLAEGIKKLDPESPDHPLFINHSLWNRRGDRVYFYVRGAWSNRAPGTKKINVPCSIHSDGTGLIMHDIFIGGHPEWAEDTLVIGRLKKDQVLYDVDKQKIVGKLGTPEIFPNPEGDISLSPDGKWFVNGFKKDSKNYYAVYRRSDGAHLRSKGLDKGKYSGDIRIDPAPRWNRSNDAILVPGIAKNGTRQMFVIRVVPHP